MKIYKYVDKLVSLIFGNPYYGEEKTHTLLCSEEYCNRIYNDTLRSIGVTDGLKLPEFTGEREA